MSKTVVTCEECNWTDILESIPFVDGDYNPMVLSCQVEGRATKKKAWEYLANEHPSAENIEDLEYDAFVYNSHAPSLSHDEPGAGHNIIGVTKGFWGFES